MDADEEPVAAGELADWLARARTAIREGTDADVPCGSCTACCTAAQFVHIGPDETDTLARIPAGWRVPAPGLPPGHVVLGYDERGHCPMLVEGACSIYEHRPRTCRVYDCRVFPAAGVAPGDHQPAIAARAARWRFSFDSPSSRQEHEAVRAAAVWLRAHPDAAPDGRPLGAPPQLAAAAVEAHRAFLGDPRPDAAAVRVELSRRFPERSRSGAKGPGAMGR
jgi:Fe-S-cluster containining protein